MPLTPEVRQRLDAVSEELWCVMDVATRPGLAVYTHVAKGWEAALGWTAEEMVGKAGVDFVFPEDRERAQAARQAMRDGKDIGYFESRLLKKGGGYRWFRWRCHFLKDSPYLVAVARDVTDEKQAYSAEKAARAALAEQLAAAARDRKEMHLLSELADLLGACVTMPEAYRVIALYGQTLFDGSPGGLAVISSSRNLVEVQASWGDSLGEKVFSPSDCWALRRGRLHLVESITSGLRCPHAADVPMPHLCIPLVAQGETLGVLHVQAAQGRADGIQDLAQAVASRVGLALANFALREALRAQSFRDSLTGLYNKRFLDETLVRELVRAERKARPLSIISLDLDHFKRTNDTFGHEAGNVALKAVAGALRSALRKDDTLCRVGGEEFLAVLAETPQDTAMLVAEKLLASVRGMDIQDRDVSLPRMTLSAGVACFPDTHTDLDGLLRAADAALYRAKKGGRDRAEKA